MLTTNSYFDKMVIESEVSKMAEWERLQIEFEQLEELRKIMSESEE